MATGNLLIIQGGGPTPVFNASLSSIVEEAMIHDAIGAVFGARFGMKGLSMGDLIPLGQLSREELAAIRNSPGAALGSSRHKSTEEDLQSCMVHLRRNEIRQIIFMGGNGTMRGAQFFLDHCHAAGMDLQIMGVPKTIDNDIAATDRCPGFASAARYVAQSTLDLSADIRSLRQPISILETLGRDVGWLSASSCLARQAPDDAPHLVYLPEIPFVQDRFLSDLDDVVSRLGWAIVVVSEGLSYADGTPVFEQYIPSTNGTHNRPLIGGVAQFLSGVVGEHLGIRARSEKPGLIGRSCMAHIAPQDLIDAELVGREGVRALLAGYSGCMVSLSPLHHGRADTTLVSLLQAGGPRRAVPTDWLSPHNLAMTEEFRSYLQPLTGELHHPWHLQDGAG